MRVSIHLPNGSFISYPIPDDVNLASGTSSTYIGDENMSREDKLLADHTHLAAMLEAANKRITELIKENKEKDVLIADLKKRLETFDGELGNRLRG